MLHVEELSFAYAASEPILSGCSFSAGEGELVALLGANGSGKSTLLTLLAGLARPGSGSIRLNGIESPGGERALRRQAALSFQEADLQLIGATVDEDLELSARSVGGVPAEELDSLRSRFGLDGLGSKPVQHLSGGQKRKLCLAGLLIRRPQLVLFDEPFSGLDFPAASQLRQHLLDNKGSGLTQIVATHDVEPVLDLADRCLVLQSGRLTLQGAPEEVLDRLECFGVRQPCLWRSERRIGCWE